jgi:hypothetical protein
MNKNICSTPMLFCAFTISSIILVSKSIILLVVNSYTISMKY